MNEALNFNELPPLLLLGSREHKVQLAGNIPRFRCNVLDDFWMPRLDAFFSHTYGLSDAYYILPDHSGCGLLPVALFPSNGG